MTILHGVTGDTGPGDTEPRRVALRATSDGKLLVDGAGGGSGGGGLTEQETADAMATAPAETPATGSVTDYMRRVAEAVEDTDPVVTSPSAPGAVMLLSAAETTGAGAGASLPRGRKSFSATVAGTGSIAATVRIEISNDGAHWRPMVGADEEPVEIVLSGTNAATDGFVTDETWLMHRANVTAITGTGAAVTVIAGV